jgi:predicted transposase/invertase (TIGR01784 family)
MNDHTILNLEMQVVDQSNWVERSMSYLCRTFDNLEHGKDYIDVKPAVQIGLLNYTLFPETPEFYASYYLMNEKTYQKYSDKIRLSVLDLTRIDLATDEDRLYGIDHWAKLFKSTTWEELKMLAQNNEVMSDAVSTVYEITQDPRLVDKIRAREEWTALENRKKREAEEVKRELAEKDQQLAESEAVIADLQSTVTDLQTTVASLLEQLQNK